MSRPAVVQLGAGPVQQRLVARIAQADCLPIVIDRAARPRGMAAEALHVRAPIDDPTAILEALKALPDFARPVAVLTSTDLGVGSVPVVSRALGLPAPADAAIAAMDDKRVGRERLAAAGLSVPRGRSFSPGEAISFPDGAVELVVKPVDSSGSRGVERVSNPRILPAAVQRAFAFGERILIEECVHGTHLDVNGTVVDGRFELVSIGERQFTDPPRCVPIQGGVLASAVPERAARVARAMQRAVEAFGYAHGPVKADLIETRDGLVFLELAARFHGDVFSTHVAEAAGRAPAALHWLARLGPVSPPEETPANGAWFGVFAGRAGLIERVVGAEAFRAADDHRVWIPRLRGGDAVGPPVDNRALVGFGVMRVASPSAGGAAAVWNAARRERERIRVQLVDRPRTPASGRSLPL